MRKVVDVDIQQILMSVTGRHGMSGTCLGGLGIGAL